MRLQDKRRREWDARHRAEAERLKAEAAAQEQADARAKAIAHAEAQAHAQVEAQARQMAHAAEQAREAAEEANARADRERAVAAHREALELLPQVQATQKQELERKHANDLAALPNSLAVETQRSSVLKNLRGAELLNSILEEKARINYLIAHKSQISENRHERALLFVGTDPLELTNEQYEAILGSRSVNSGQAHQVHQAWAQTYADALDAKLYSYAVTQLNDRSASLSEHYAKASWTTQQSANNDKKLSLKKLAETGRFWSVVAGPTAPSKEFPSAADKAKGVAEKFFTRQASKILGRALPRLALLYPTELANSAIGPSILAAPASELGVARDLDLDFIASRKGTTEVTHRMTFNESEGELSTAWADANGVTVGTKVPVRSLVYNPNTNGYDRQP